MLNLENLRELVTWLFGVQEPLKPVPIQQKPTRKEPIPKSPTQKESLEKARLSYRDY